MYKKVAKVLYDDLQFLDFFFAVCVCVCVIFFFSTGALQHLYGHCFPLFLCIPFMCNRQFDHKAGTSLATC
jgi:hypothetical protein